jgi:Spy/CpxP family protein refolding chaperone
MEILTKDKVDTAALEELRVRQIRLADDASRTFTRALADAAEVLNPAQRKQLAAHFARRHGRWGHA